MGTPCRRSTTHRRTHELGAVTALYARAVLAPRADSVAVLGQQAEAVGWSQPVTVRTVFVFSIFDYISRNWYKLQKMRRK
jgi:hypothetical protein